MSETFPLVGVSACYQTIEGFPSHTVHDKYVEAVSIGAGAVPVILPASGEALAERVVESLDGILLTGSASNLEASLYDSDTVSDGPFDPRRDATCLRLVALAIQRDIPVLAICRGMQELNVALGGTLQTQMDKDPDFAVHVAADSEDLSVRYGARHEIHFASGGLFTKIIGRTSARVNSLHTQRIRDLADDLEIEAKAEDGVIEAVRLPQATFVVGVQWHPEWEFQRDDVSSPLFKAFGDAVRSRCRARAAR
ncbi:gamma-glutamyl-gamma-aminobutyrate hydrolase family protein [Paraburkholderia sp. EG286A]|uniref:gamma-glutamyl-gamma-aminobutyrate hydrolase family protein n=1 Tax=Paraburkholderia sp. EG286A TaxID=3237014 RepID=UPI0034D20526